MYAHNTNKYLKGFDIIYHLNALGMFTQKVNPSDFPTTSSGVEHF